MSGWGEVGLDRWQDCILHPTDMPGELCCGGGIFPGSVGTFCGFWAARRQFKKEHWLLCQIEGGRPKGREPREK